MIEWCSKHCIIVFSLKFLLWIIIWLLCFPFICLFVCLMNNSVSSSIRKICNVNIKVQTKYGTQIGLQKQIMLLYIHLYIFLQSTCNGFIHTAVANFAWCCLILGLYRTACINTKRYTGIICSIKASRWRKTRHFCTYTVKWF